MTTIAVNKTGIACDLQFTHSGGIKFKGKTKVVDLKPEVAKSIFGAKRVLIGFAGNADIWGELVAWFAVPTDKPPKLKNIELLMLTDEGKIYHGTNLQNWMQIDEPYFSIGSGMHLAIAAMAAGATPAEAVRIASKHDPNTGRGIKEYKL
jgi:ATP-dependent protease HslVU (ClpYQ) peptidase subunit